MKTKILAAMAACLMFWSLPCGFALEGSTAQDDLKALIANVKTKLKEGKTTEADLAPELAEFDRVLTRHKDEKTDDVAQILFMKAQLYLEILDNTEKAIELVKQIKTDYPDTKLGKSSDEILDSIKKQEESKRFKGPS